jgi:hypothetical protein
MTTAAWEYLYVTYTYGTSWRYYNRKRHERSPEPASRQTWKHVYRISRRDSEVEVLDGEEPRWPELLHQFGAEGWELASERVDKTTIADFSAGWSDVAIPVKIAWTFKRPVANT